MNKKFIWFLKLGLAVLLLWVLIQKIEPDNLKSAFQQAQLKYIFIALLLVLPNVYVQFLKWRFLLRLVKPAVSDYEAASSLFAGFALGFVTPGRIGELGRALFIENCSRTQLVGLATIDKLFSMSAVFLVGALGLFLLLGVHLNSSYFYLWLAIFGIAMVTVFLLTLFPQKLQSLLLKLKQILPYKKRIELFSSCLDNFKRAQAIRMFGFGLIFYAVITTQYILLFFAFEQISIFLGYLVVFSLFITKSLFPISLGDLGIRETAAVFFIGLIGAQESTAFNASILVFLINLALPSLTGFFFMLTPKMNRQFLNYKIQNAVKTPVVE